MSGLLIDSLYQMMELLMRSRGHRICAEEIARRVWGEEKAGSELIWVHISSLRGKLDKIGAKIMLSNNDVPLVRELYAGYRIQSLDVKRMINRNANQRTGKEVLVTNY